MTARQAVVAGAGVGGLTTAALLARRGWDVAVGDEPVRSRPVLVLHEVALALLDDLWGPGVVDNDQVITTRRVRWGPAAGEVAVPVKAVAVDGRELVERLRARLGSLPTRFDGPAWEIDGTKPSGPQRRVVFGRRWVLQATVALTAGDASTAWIETVRDGWVHLAPVSGGRGVVQCMVPAPLGDPESTLGRMVADTAGIRCRIGLPEGTVSAIPAAPAFTDPPCSPGRVSVADGAASLDPLSGSGTAWALRSGILAAAVLEAVASGMDEHRCLRHYGSRLRAALHDHVARCLQLYGAAFFTPSWQRELDLMATALEHDRRTHPPAEFDLRLDGLRLEPRPAPAR